MERWEAIDRAILAVQRQEAEKVAKMSNEELRAHVREQAEKVNKRLRK